MVEVLSLSSLLSDLKFVLHAGTFDALLLIVHNIRIYFLLLRSVCSQF